MGSAEQKSTRFTVNNDNNVVFVSQALLDKLTKNESQQQQQQTSFNAASMSPAGGESKVAPNVAPSKKEESKSVPSDVPKNDSVSLEIVAKAYEDKLKQQEAKWRYQVEKLEQFNDQLLKQNSIKLAEEVGQFEQRHFGNLATVYTKSPCQLAELALTECYSRNGKRSLLCSEEVKAFSECVRLAAFELLSESSTR